MGSHDSRLRGPARALLVIEHPVLAEVVKLVLNHGNYSTRVTPTVEEAARALIEWRPHLAVLDMDIAGGAALDRLCGVTGEAGRLPIVALTRRGDLKTRLAAFDAGVDDILTVPSHPRSLSRGSWRSAADLP
jgi:DNA-binding response OmpR family regulator